MIGWLSTGLPPGLMVLAGIVQLIPLIGVSGRASIARLYDVTPADDATTLLLRHRAVLLGLVGVIPIGGAFHGPLQWPALATALASKLSYLMLYATAPPGNAKLTRVARVDLVTSTLLVVAAAILVGAQVSGQ